MTKRITISLPDGLAAEIESAAGRNVSAWLAGAAAQRLFAASMAALHQDLDPAEESRLRAILNAQQESVAGDQAGRRAA